MSTLPRSASEASFDTSVSGRTGWADFEGVFMLYDVDLSLAFLAALSVLADNGFTVNDSSLDKGYAIGRSRTGFKTWPAHAGVYLRAMPADLCYGGTPCITVKVQIEGATEDGEWVWNKGSGTLPQKIFDGMNKYIQTRVKSPAGK